jgi:HEAT repeat protein
VRVAQEIALFESEDLTVRLGAATQLGRLGEPAASALLRTLAEHPSARTRGMAAYTLGFLRDHRALDPLARALQDPDPEVRSEAATALARNGDDRGLATLIRGLEDADPRVRSRSIVVLHEAVGESLGFQPDDDPLDRQAAVARWKSWLKRRRDQQG